MKSAWIGLGLAVFLTGCGPLSASPSDPATPTPTLAAPAQSVVFDGDSFFMVDATESKRGLIKEFLLDGETFEDNTRKVTFRLTPGKDLREQEKVYLAQFDSGRSGYVQRVMYRSRKRLDEDFLFPDGEYQMWAWRLTPRGVESFEFSLKMKDKAALKTLVDTKRELWRKDLERMGKTIPTILKASS